MAQIDHHPLRQSGRGECLAGLVDAAGIVVRLAAATEDDMTVFVAERRYDRRISFFSDRQEMMRMLGRPYRVHRDSEIAVRSVLESNRTRQPRSEFAMDLALGRPRADRSPAHEVGHVLG